MNESISANTSAPASRRDRELVRACAILTAIVLVAIPVAALATAHGHGSANWLTTLMAAGACWLGATVSLIITDRARQRGAALKGILLAMLVRMTIPLGIAVLAVASQSTLASGGLVGQILIFYLLTLSVETVLSVSLVKAGSAVPQGGSPHA